MLFPGTHISPYSGLFWGLRRLKRPLPGAQRLQPALLGQGESQVYRARGLGEQGRTGQVEGLVKRPSERLTGLGALCEGLLGTPQAAQTHEAARVPAHFVLEGEQDVGAPQAPGTAWEQEPDLGHISLLYTATAVQWHGLCLGRPSKPSENRPVFDEKKDSS
jgi:hypothetical protein